MVKNAISDYSSTAASNTDVGGINIDEGMSPSGVNNAIRELMSHLADLNAGSSSLGTIKVDNLQLDGNAITSTDTNGNITLTPNGTGSVVIDGINYPQADGTANYFLKTDGAGQLSFAQVDTASIADDAITAAKINVTGNGTAGQFLASDGDGSMTWTDAGGGFAYNAVSGTTPSLDLGSYNFFNQGALTGNTTVSFASVPTEHKWTYTYNTAGASATDDVTKLAFTGMTYSVASETTAPKGIHFKSDGTKMFMISSAEKKVFEYDLSSAWDVTTASYSGTSLDVSSQENNASDLFFKTDGTELYIVGTTQDAIIQYNLSTAWDLSTATYDSSDTLNTLTSAAGDPSFQNFTGLTFKPDGTAFWVCESDGDTVEFNLSTAWDASTVSYTAGNYVSLSDAGILDSNANDTQAIAWNSDGTKLYTTGYSSDNVNTVTFATAYDITSTVSSTASSKTFGLLNGDYFNPELASYAIYVKSDGETLFVSGAHYDRVEAYVMTDPYTLTLPSSVKEVVESTFHNHRVSLDFFTADGGTNVHLIGQSQSRII